MTVGNGWAMEPKPGPWFQSEHSDIRARVILDSINPDGDRVTTVEAIFNRYLLAELNTHRMLSRNSASSRAIPVRKVLSQVLRRPAVPISWGANQAGMQARSDLVGWRRWLAKRLFLWARLPILVVVWLLSKVGLHKQVANRLLEPWVWHTAVITATEWDNVWKLRLHPDAQPEFQELARCMKAAMDASVPVQMRWGSWHQPYLTPEDYGAVAAWASDHDTEEFQMLLPPLSYVSSARCAAVSYVRQGEARDAAKDIALATRLQNSGHWSPFEHVAMAEPGRSGNFIGWKQFRKFFPGESGAISREKCLCGGSSCYACPRCG